MILCGDINAFYNNEVLQLTEKFPKILFFLFVMWGKLTLQNEC